jgi:hypothetical protein
VYSHLSCSTNLELDVEASKFESMEDIPWKRDNPGFKFKTILTLFETASHQHRKISSGKDGPLQG